MLDSKLKDSSCRICARDLCGNHRRWIFHAAAKVNLQTLLSHALGREVTRDGRGEFACGKCAFVLERMYRFDTVIARVEALSIERMQRLLQEKERLRQGVGSLYWRHNASLGEPNAGGGVKAEMLGDGGGGAMDIATLSDMSYSALLQEDLAYSGFESWAEQESTLDYNSQQSLHTQHQHAHAHSRKCRGCAALRVADSDYEAVCKLPRRLRSTSCGPPTRASASVEETGSGVTPAPLPQPSPTPTPEAQPSPTPAPAPQPSPAPALQSSPTPAPEAQPSPTPAPQPSPTTAPQPSPTTAPQPLPAAEEDMEQGGQAERLMQSSPAPSVEPLDTLDTLDTLPQHGGPAPAEVVEGGGEVVEEEVVGEEVRLEGSSSPWELTAHQPHVTVGEGGDGGEGGEGGGACGSGSVLASGLDLALALTRSCQYRPVQSRRGSRLPVRVTPRPGPGPGLGLLSRESPPHGSLPAGAADWPLSPLLMLGGRSSRSRQGELQHELAEMEELWLDEFAACRPAHLQEVA